MAHRDCPHHLGSWMDGAGHQCLNAAVLGRQQQAVHGGELWPISRRGTERRSQQPLNVAAGSKPATGHVQGTDLPPGQTFLYLLGHGLPFLMVPLISLDAWVLAGPSLLGLFLAQGSNDPLSITIRYTLLVVPGFSLGALLWWSRRQQAIPGRRTRLAWGMAISLSLLLTVSSNPHRSLSWIVPDSVSPMVFSSPIQQWEHGQDARQVLNLIPKDASVSANTPLIPLIARREVAVRYPESLHYLDRNKNKLPVDWIAVDLDWLERYSVAFRSDWRELSRVKQELPDQMGAYRVQGLTHACMPIKNLKTMPPTRDWPGALAGSALARNRLISQKTMPSAGVLRDQQTLGQTTGTHGHLLLDG